jgi:hypothetical protein
MRARDLDMKKPLAALGMRGCRAGVPTRLGKEGNPLHTVRVAHLPMGDPLVLHHQGPSRRQNPAVSGRE